MQMGMPGLPTGSPGDAPPASANPALSTAIRAACDRLIALESELNRLAAKAGDGDTGSTDVDGLKGKEGAFLLTTFWLADNLALMGRHDEAKEIFERLLSLRNDVGLLSEEYDPDARRMLGNFPQAFSHTGLIRTAANLSLGDKAPDATRSARPSSG